MKETHTNLYETAWISTPLDIGTLGPEVLFKTPSIFPLLDTMNLQSRKSPCHPTNFLTIKYNAFVGP